MTARQSFSVMMLLSCFLLSGCGPNLTQTKQKTDQQVYKIIDDTWQQDFGSKVNYKISDTAADSNELYAPPQLPSNGVLSLSRALDIATHSNRQYNTEKENLYLTALDLTEIRHIYEPMPIWGADAGYRQDEGNEGAGAFTNYGFSQLLATGAQIGADVSLGWLDIMSGDMHSGSSSIISAVVSQPLLRGAGRKIALENLTQGQRNTLYQIRSFNRYRKEFVAQIATEYHRVLELYDRQRNIGAYYIELSKICYSLRKRAKVGRVEIHELEEAEQDRMIAQSNYVAAMREYEQALDAFKMQLSIQPNLKCSLDINELLIYQIRDLADFSITEENAIDMALHQRLDLANASDIVEDAHRKVDMAADAIRAELNIVGYATVQPSNRTAFGVDPGQLQATRDRYQLAVQLDLPIDRLTEKNNYRRALITLMQQQRLHQERADTVILQVRQAYRNMKEARRRYEIEIGNYRLAGSRTQHTLSLNRYGRASIRDVLDAQEDLLDASNARTTALVDYFEASLNFLRDTGTMKIRANGTWQKPDSFLTRND